MIEGGEDLGFTLETRHAIGIERRRVGQDLYRNAATELGVARAIHFAHPACAERRDDFVEAESPAGLHRHVPRPILLTLTRRTTRETVPLQWSSLGKSAPGSRRRGGA